MDAARLLGVMASRLSVWTPLFVLAMVACGDGWGERPEVVHGPANQTVIAGQTATFSVSVTGTAPPRYQWSRGRSGAGVTRRVLAVGAGILLRITAAPQTAYIADDTLASFTAGATCTGCIPAYQWYLYAPGSTTANALPGFDTFQNGNAQGIPAVLQQSGNGRTLRYRRRSLHGSRTGCVASLGESLDLCDGDLNTQGSADYSASTFANSTHLYVVTVVNSIMTVTMDGYELFAGNVTLPPAAYLGFTASTGGSEEAVTFSNLTATVSAP